jgi:FkbM family methyltransferase
MRVVRKLRYLLGTLKLRLFPVRYEPEVVAAIERAVPKGATCADVGAHVGAITRVLTRVAGASGRVIAFEAYPPNAEGLRDALAREGIDGVVVENIAVTDGAEPTVWLHPGRHRSSAEWNLVGHDVEGHQTPAELEVPVTSLDAYFPAGQRLDFVKIDVEGAEDRVLAGMTRLLADARPVVLVEFHDDQGWAARRHLLDAGYRLERVTGEPVGADADRVYHCLARPS